MPDPAPELKGAPFAGAPYRQRGGENETDNSKLPVRHSKPPSRRKNMPAFRNPGQHSLSRFAAAYGMSGAKPFWLQAMNFIMVNAMYRVLGLPSHHMHSGPKPDRRHTPG